MIVLLWTDLGELFRESNNLLIFFCVFIVFIEILLYTIKSRRNLILRE